jgi:hypothetical protein
MTATTTCACEHENEFPKLNNLALLKQSKARMFQTPQLQGDNLKIKYKFNKTNSRFSRGKPRILRQVIYFCYHNSKAGCLQNFVQKSSDLIGLSCGNDFNWSKRFRMNNNEETQEISFEEFEDTIEAKGEKDKETLLSHEEEKKTFDISAFLMKNKWYVFIASLLFLNSCFLFLVFLKLGMQKQYFNERDDEIQSLKNKLDSLIDKRLYLTSPHHIRITINVDVFNIYPLSSQYCKYLDTSYSSQISENNLMNYDYLDDCLMMTTKNAKLFRFNKISQREISLGKFTTTLTLPASTTYLYANIDLRLVIYQNGNNQLCLNTFSQNLVLESNYNTDVLPVFDVQSNSLLYLSEIGLKFVELSKRNAVVLNPTSISDYSMKTLKNNVLISYFHPQLNTLKTIHCSDKNCYKRFELDVSDSNNGNQHILGSDQFENPIIAFIDGKNKVLKYWYKDMTKILTKATSEISMVNGVDGGPIILFKLEQKYQILICLSFDCSYFQIRPLNTQNYERKNFKLWRGYDLYPVLTYSEVESGKTQTVVEVCKNTTCVG